MSASAGGVHAVPELPDVVTLRLDLEVEVEVEVELPFSYTP